jgi:hypothetical protein
VVNLKLLPEFCTKKKELRSGARSKKDRPSAVFKNNSSFEIARFSPIDPHSGHTLAKEHINPHPVHQSFDILYDLC